MILIFTILRVAFKALSRNKMRSILTMLGIIIGVAAVIAMVSIGQGAQQTISQQIGAMGSNMLFVQPGAWNSGGVRMGIGTTSHLTVEDSQSIERECPAVKYVSPMVRSSCSVVFGKTIFCTLPFPCLCKFYGAVIGFFTNEQYPAHGY